MLTLNRSQILLELQGVSYAYTDVPIISNLSFSLTKGQIGCLLGPSGCGKTTVLRCIAGFEAISSGEIRLNGESVSRKNFLVPPEKRHIGVVFQDYALFPHLTISQNIAFGLHQSTNRDRSARVTQMLDIVGLTLAAQAYPHELSGGQQQRAALARALAPCPSLLLLDEPFSNLDIDLRERLGQEIRDILKTQNTTAIMVTHDQHDAFAIADEVGVMAHGTIQQWDSAYNLYHRPRNRFVADFVGQGVFLPGKVLSKKQIEIELGVLNGVIPEDSTVDALVDVLVRPDDIVHDDASAMVGKVINKAFRGAEFLYTLMLPSQRIIYSLVPSHHDHAIGEDIGIKLAVDHVIAFKPQIDQNETLTSYFHNQ